MIFIRLAGGLGNQLFQLAAALHVQAKNNMPISFYTDHLKNYETPREFMLLEILPKDFTVQFSKPSWIIQSLLKYRINKVLPSLFNWSITTKNIATLRPSKFYVLDDYFQDILELENELEVVAKYIQQAASSNKKVIDIFTANNKFVNAVALHIRRGDFLNKSNANVFFTQTNAYYTNAIAALTNIQKIFLFCETEEDISSITILPFCVVKQYCLTDIEEFLLMTKFQNLIIANSTYSFWAAVSAKSHNVIAPKKWYLNKKDNNIWLSNLQLVKFNTVA